MPYLDDASDEEMNVPVMDPAMLARFIAAKRNRIGLEQDRRSKGLDYWRDNYLFPNEFNVSGPGTANTYTSDEKLKSDQSSLKAQQSKLSQQAKDMTPEMRFRMKQQQQGFYGPRLPPLGARVAGQTQDDPPSADRSPENSSADAKSDAIAAGRMANLASSAEDRRVPKMAPLQITTNEMRNKQGYVRDMAQNPASLPQREAGLFNTLKGIEGQFSNNKNFSANPMTEEEKQFTQPTLRERLMRKAATPTGSKFTRTGEGVDATLQTPDARGPAGRGNLWAALSGSSQGRQMARPLSDNSGEDSMASLSPEDRRAHLQGTGYKGDFTRRAPGMANDTFGKYAPPNAPGRGGQAGQLPGGSRILRGENGGIALEGPAAYGTDAEKEYLARVSKQAGLSSPAPSMEAFKQQQQAAAKASYDRIAQQRASSLQAMLMGRSGGQLAEDADTKTKNAYSVGQRQQQALASRLAGGQQQQAAQEQQFLAGLVRRASSPEEAAKVYQLGNSVLQARKDQQNQNALTQANIGHLNAQNTNGGAHAAAALIQEARQYRVAATQSNPEAAKVLMQKAAELDAKAAQLMGGGAPTAPPQMIAKPAKPTADELMANTPVAKELAAAAAAEEDRRKKREANRFGPLTPQRSSAPWGAG